MTVKIPSTLMETLPQCHNHLTPPPRWAKLPAIPLRSPATCRAAVGTSQLPPPPHKRSNPSLLEPLHPYLAGNALVRGDNYDVLQQLPDECVDLIYLDPPFNSNQFYVAAFGDKGRVGRQLRDIWRWTAGTERAFQDIEARAFTNSAYKRLLDCLKGVRLQAGDTSDMAAYIVYMARRLMEMRRVLKRTGSIYLHCDWHANAYLRILMDAILNEKQFRNEIIWSYRTGGVSKRYWPRKHDTLFFYLKSDSYAHNPIQERIFYDKPFFTEQVDEEGRYFADVYVRDIWDDVKPIINVSNERIGYPTQKPLALLERIIKASSNPGDLVLDPFCGCGTAADAAAMLGRKYLGIDISGIAVRVMQQRLGSRGEAVSPVVYGLEWTDFEWQEFEERALMSRDDAEDGTPGWEWAEDKVAALLNAVPNEVKVGDGGIDARYYGAVDIVRNEGITIPIQVKMWRSDRPVGRPEMDRLLGVQTAMQNRGLHAPMSLMVSLYSPSNALRTFAAQQGRVTISTLDEGAVDYPVMQVLSVQDMLLHDERPKLPPVDPRSLVGDTQDKMLIV